MTDAQTRLLHELEPIVEQNLERHLSDGPAVGATRLRAVEPRKGFRLPGRRGLATRGLPAGPGRQGRTHGEPAHRGQPALLPPRDRHPVRARRRVGHLGRPMDRRGGPAQHRAARLPGGHPRSGPVQAGGAAHGAHHRRIRLRRQDSAGRAGLRVLPGARHPGVAPQHRPCLRLPDRRSTARPDRRRREPAHGLLPQSDGGRAGHRARCRHGGHPRRGRRLHHARARAWPTSARTRS